MLRKAQTKFLFLIIFFSSIGGPVQLMAQYKNSNVIDKIIARIDNQILLKSELEVAFLQSKQNQAERGERTKCQILESLLINKMMLAKAELDSITVEDKMVNEQLDRRMQYMLGSVGSKEKLEAYYKKSVDQIKQELKRDVKEQMIIQKVQDGISAKIKVTPAEVKRFFNEIPKDSLPFFSTEVEVGHIVKVIATGKNSKVKARQQLAEIKKKIEEGAKFEDMARLYSQDPGSAREGGELGFWERGAMVPEFEAAALKLKPGELSDLVESAFGFHLIELLEVKGNRYNSRHILIKPDPTATDKEETEAEMLEIRSKIVSDSISFEKAAKKYSDDQETKNNGGLFMDETTRSARIPTENLDPIIFFTIDTMKVGQVSRILPYRTADNKEALRFIYYKSKMKPHEANLKDDFQKISYAALQNKKSQAIDEWFVKTRSELFITIDPEYEDCDLLSVKDNF